MLQSEKSSQWKGGIVNSDGGETQKQTRNRKGVTYCEA